MALVATLLSHGCGDDSGSGGSDGSTPIDAEFVDSPGSSDGGPRRDAPAAEASVDDGGGADTSETDSARPIDADVDAGVASDSGAPSCESPRPWECVLDDAVGFGENVTGGAGGALCWVENLNSSGSGSLRSCLDAPGPTWIVFRVSGTITMNMNVPSDTTIDGRGQRIEIRSNSSHGINTLNASNILLTHLVLSGAELDLVRAWNTSRDVWLDHLTLSGSGDESMDIDAPGTTVSWCRFLDATYAMLIGGGDGDFSELYITLHHNYFSNNRERHPRVRGKVHSYNNVIDYVSSGGRVSLRGHLLSERNIYRTSGTGAALVSRPGGAITVGGFYRSVNDVFEGGAFADTPNDPSPVFEASTFYEYTADAPDTALDERVRARAGWQDVPLPMP